MSPSESLPNPESVRALPQLPRDDGGPIFAEPWQATAFALAVRLSAEGYFTWKEWAAPLADELKVAAQHGEPDDASHYYQAWQSRRIGEARAEEVRLRLIWRSIP